MGVGGVERGEETIGYLYTQLGEFMPYSAMLPDIPRAFPERPYQ